MADINTDLAIATFTSNLSMVVQQKSSKLRGRVAEGPHVGRAASPVNYIKPVKMKVPQGRYAQLVVTQAEFERRWVFPKDRDLTQMLDTFDEVRTIVDPKSAYVTGAGSAVGREWDDGLIAAATASASIGRDIDGLSPESFSDTTYGVAVDYDAGAATGLTVAKLIELRRKLTHYATDGDPDDEQFVLVVGSQGQADLLGQTQVVSTEFNDRPVLVDGKVTRFMGFDIVVLERLATSSTVRTCLGFLKSGLYLGVWSETQNDVTQRKDITSLPWQLYTKMTYGATRLEKGKLFVVYTADTTGASITP